MFGLRLLSVFCVYSTVRAGGPESFVALDLCIMRWADVSMDFTLTLLYMEQKDLTSV